MSIADEIARLNHSAEIELFEIDATRLGGAIHRFHGGTNELGGPVIWQGHAYEPKPVKVDGFEADYEQRPRPKLTIANINGGLGLVDENGQDEHGHTSISGLIINYDELLGAKLTRFRTLARYLDAANFREGNPSAGPDEMPRDVYFIKRREEETALQVVFELGTPDDALNRKIPARPITARCDATYRDIETGCDWNPGPDGPFFDINDNPTTAEHDVCSHCPTGCTIRFGEGAALPYMGFPAAQLIRS